MHDFVDQSPTASADDSNANSGAVYIYRNNARLFEVADLTASKTTTTVTLTWTKTGGTANGYQFSYQTGTTAPADCETGTQVDAGDVATYQESSLTTATTYSFRLCSDKDGSTFSDGRTITVTTD